MANACALIIDNREGIEPIIEAHERFLPKDWPVYWLKNEATSTIQEYSRLMVSKRLWRNLSEWVLIFQHDSELLRPGVENYLEWEMCGSPIRWLPGMMNGGLSIRNSKSMLKVINHIPYKNEPEDLYFCNGLKQLNGKLPTIEEAMKFSVETMYYPTPIGIHAPDKYLTKEQCFNLRNTKP